MALGKSPAIVIGGFPIGESDRVVSFFSRDFGKVRGVAKGARRMTSRFGSALELLTLGTLVFFDSGRSELVRVDHFDILRPFDRVRDHLDRLGEGAWMVECLTRLTPDRDPQPPLYGLLARALGSLESGVRPPRVAVAFGVRCIGLLGHRLRTDACVHCGRRWAAERASVPVDVDGGGIVCASCAGPGRDVVTVAGSAIVALRRLSTGSWAEAVTVPIGRAETEVRAVLDTHIARLSGQAIRSTRFLRELGRLSPIPGGAR